MFISPFISNFAVVFTAMTIQELQQLCAKSPKVAALAKAVGNVRIRNIFLDGLLASSAPLAFAALEDKAPATILFILNDADEAGYFYHDQIGRAHV